MQWNPYLTFNGRCEEAFKFYARCLGGKIDTMITHAGTPAEQHMPANWGNKILHAHLTVDNQILMGSDPPPERYQQPKGISVALQIKDVKEAERVFHALSENGTITMPMQETFFAARFGMFTDQFGIPWMINSEKAG